jgi:hypothetical protein
METDYLYKKGEKYLKPIFGYDEDGFFCQVDSVEVDNEETIVWYIKNGKVIEYE